MGFRVFGTGLYSRLEAAPLEMFRDRATGGCGRIRFCVGKGGDAARRHAPMIEHPRDMANLRGLEPLEASQHQIVVLRALEAFAEPADRSQQVGAVKPEMVDEVLAQEKLRVPIRFEERIQAIPGGIDLVLVGIDKPRLGMRLDLERDACERVGGQRIILVEQGAPVAGGKGKGGVRTGCDVAIARAESHLDPRLCRSHLFEPGPDLRIGRSIVRDAKLPAFVNLLMHGCDRGLERGQVGVVDRLKNRNQRLHAQLPELSSQSHLVDLRITLQPIVISGRRFRTRDFRSIRFHFLSVR